MRGQDSRSGSLFSYVDLEQRVRSDHPLRTIRTFGERGAGVARRALRRDLLGDRAPLRSRPSSFCGRCCCRPSTRYGPERQLMEQLDFNLLFRWFVGLGVDDPVWDASTFSKNRDRLLDGSVAAAFSERRAGHPAGETASVAGPLQRGRHPDPGLGLDEELQAQRWHDARASRAASRRAQRRGGFSRPTAPPTTRTGALRIPRHGFTARGGAREAQAQLHGARPHGEPPSGASSDRPRTCPGKCGSKTWHMSSAGTRIVSSGTGNSPSGALRSTW